MSGDYADQWRCRFCGRDDFPVPSLARTHEQTCEQREA
jgi:hypothetical protein